MAESIFGETDELEALKKRVGELEQILQALNSRNLGGIKASDLLAITAQNWGDGSDGNVTITGTTTLTRDMFYDTLTINAGGILQTASFRVFVKTLLTNSGTIRNNGSAAADDIGASAVAAGSLPGGTAGKNGGASVNGGGGAGSAGNAGTAGDNVSRSLGGVGSGGGGGGNGGGGNGGNGGSGGNGGNGGSVSSTPNNLPRNPISAYMLFDPNGTAIALFTASAGGGSGGGGGAGGGNGGSGTGGTGRFGGGSGSSGGYIAIFAREIINNGTIQVKGGAGANGGTGGNASGTNSGGGGGGGGGAGGSGGILILVYGSLSGSGTTDVSGGAGGSAGVGGTGTGSGVNGNNGTAGTAGASGTLISLQLSS